MFFQHPDGRTAVIPNHSGEPLDRIAEQDSEKRPWHEQKGIFETWLESSIHAFTHSIYSFLYCLKDDTQLNTKIKEKFKSKK